MVLAFAFLMVWWRLALKHLIEQDGGMTRAELTALRRKARTEGRDVLADFWRASLQYLRPGFHPDDNDDRHLAEDYFATQAAA